ncbi:uncharacterized protein NPIL_425091 [Nephila pilipes]|uniref:Uncharacterized protein n=1 Tax=Nephila pilipes TaxID=299642 RepID=A0A8X6T6P6_NEPPI|nr:uncharacterized protein NPIL_425091 [Nephila pilipes]
MCFDLFPRLHLKSLVCELYFRIAVLLLIMDIKRSATTFVPTVLSNCCILTEDVKKIALMKGVLRSYTVDKERAFRSIQRRLKEGQRKLDRCTQESNEIELKLNTVEMKIAEAFMLTQEAESEALQTVKENGTIKRNIIALKNDLEIQERAIKRARETMQAISKDSNKKRKLMPDRPT